MSSVNDEFVVPNSQQVVALECQTAFKALTKKEKLYAHYLSQSCWVGSLIVLVQVCKPRILSYYWEINYQLFEGYCFFFVFFQTSPESPVIFTLLHKVFSREPIEELTKKALTKLSEDEFKVREND